MKYQQLHSLCDEIFTPHQDLEEQLEEEESARQRLLLEKVTLDTKVKSLETDLMNAVEQRDRLSKVTSFTGPGITSQQHHTEPDEERFLCIPAVF